MERRFDLPGEGTECALRFGGYHINSDDEANRAVTGGLGYKWRGGDFFLNNKPIPFDISLDYAFMYWTGASSGTDEWTHMLGVKISIPWEFNRESAWEKGLSYFLPPDSERKADKERDLDSKAIICNEDTQDDVTDRELYYQRVRQMIMENIHLSEKIEKNTTATLFFLLSSDGRLKQFFIEEPGDDPTIKEAISQGFRNISAFPAFPEDIHKEEALFKLNISFIN